MRTASLANNAVRFTHHILRIHLSNTEVFEMSDWYMLTLVGADRFDMPGEEGLAQLSRFLSYGGFLFIDETTGAEASVTVKPSFGLSDEQIS